MSGIDTKATAVQAEVQAQEGGRVTVVLRGALDVRPWADCGGSLRGDLRA